MADTMDDVTQRVNIAAQGLLENESLTSDLDDQAAKTLLEWGLDCLRKIAQDTSGMDEAQAEEAMYPRLRATRTLLRTVNNAVASGIAMNAIFSSELISQIIEQAQVIYGPNFIPPAGEQLSAFVSLQPEPTADVSQQIQNLREWIENPL